MPTATKPQTAILIEIMIITLPIFPIVLTNPFVELLNDHQNGHHQSIATIPTTIVIYTPRNPAQHKVSSNILTSTRLKKSKSCYKIAQEGTHPILLFHFPHLMLLPSRFLLTHLLRFMSKRIRSPLHMTLEAPPCIFHGPFKPTTRLTTETLTTILNLKWIKSLTHSHAKQKRLDYGGPQTSRRKDGTGYLTNRTSQPTFPARSGKQLPTTNSSSLQCYPKTRLKTLPGPTPIIHLTQVSMMMRERLLSFNHLKQFLIIMNSLLMDKPEKHPTTSTSSHGTNGTLLGNSIRTWSSSSIHTELENCTVTSQYSRNSPRISTSKQLCVMIGIGESSSPKEEAPPCSTENLLSKGNTLPRRLQEYNTCPSKHSLTPALQILDPLPPKQYSTKGSPSAESLIGETDVRGIYADTNTSALHAASNPTENPPALNHNQTNLRNNNRLQSQTVMAQNTSSPLTAQHHNAPMRLPKYTRHELSSFRSRNNNFVWINHHSNEAPRVAQKPSAFVTPDYQWKASRDLTQLGPPENHSITLSLTAQPPENHPLTPQELKLMEDLDPLVFNPIVKIDMHKFSHYTSKHPNRALIAYLTHGLRFGFRLGYSGERRLNIMNNLSSLDLSPDTLPTFIRNERELGRISGPFSLQNPPTKIFMVNPIGLVEKRDTNPIEYRVITHHSAPHGASVNDGIDKHEFRISFDTLKHAVRWIRHFGTGALLSKIDIKDAYRNLPVHPVDQLLQGIVHDGKLYFDKALAFGARSSCGIFCRFADIIAWIAHNNGIPAIIHYVDDFLIISNPTNTADKAKFLTLLEDLKIPIKVQKLEGPSTRLIYLGFEIDSVNMTASLSAQRRHQLLDYLNKWKKKKSAHSREIRSLVGYLLWACQVLPRARPFAQRFLDLQNRTHNVDRYVNLGRDLRADLEWWIRAVSTWNGVYLFEETSWIQPHIPRFYTDASNIGAGATFENYFFAALWSSNLNPAVIDINLRELIAIVLAVSTFRSLWTRKRYILYTDNASCVANIKRGYASNPLANEIIRDIYEQQVVFSFAIKVEHIPSAQNVNADMLSRGQYSQFRTRNPQMTFLHPIIPNYLSSLIDVPSTLQNQ